MLVYTTLFPLHRCCRVPVWVEDPQLIWWRSTAYMWWKVIIVSNPTAVEAALSCIEVMVGFLTIFLALILWFIVTCKYTLYLYWWKHSFSLKLNTKIRDIFTPHPPNSATSSLHSQHQILFNQTWNLECLAYRDQSIEFWEKYFFPLILAHNCATFKPNLCLCWSVPLKGVFSGHKIMGEMVAIFLLWFPLFHFLNIVQLGPKLQSSV